MSNIPEGATHEFNGLYFKFENERWYEWRNYLDESSHWMVTFPNDDWASKNLTPIQPTQWLPEVGRECEYECTARGKEPKGGGVVKYISNYTCVVENFEGVGEFVAHPDTMSFRPIKTEREKFVERCVEIKKAHMWTEEEFVGAIFDKGARFND